MGRGSLAFITDASALSMDEYILDLNAQSS
jgi:hypothetical protein